MKKEGVFKEKEADFEEKDQSLSIISHKDGRKHGNSKSFINFPAKFGLVTIDLKEKHDVFEKKSEIFLGKRSEVFLEKRSEILLEKRSGVFEKSCEFFEKKLEKTGVFLYKKNPGKNSFSKRIIRFHGGFLELLKENQMKCEVSLDLAEIKAVFFERKREKSCSDTRNGSFLAKKEFFFSLEAEDKGLLEFMMDSESDFYGIKDFFNRFIKK